MKVCLIAGGLALLLGGPALSDTVKGRDAFRSAHYDVALKELSASAKKGDPEAFMLLGRMYATGLGVHKNMESAVDYFRMGAAAGYPPAQKEYGTALALGEGVDQDINEGLKWLIIAGRLGNRDAGEYARRLGGTFPKSVVLTAQIEASRWLRKNRKDEPPAQLP